MANACAALPPVAPTGSRDASWLRLSGLALPSPRHTTRLPFHRCPSHCHCKSTAKRIAQVVSAACTHSSWGLRKCVVDFGRVDPGRGLSDGVGVARGGPKSRHPRQRLAGRPRHSMCHRDRYLRMAHDKARSVSQREQLEMRHRVPRGWGAQGLRRELNSPRPQE